MQLNAAGHAASQVLKERCEAIAQRVASLYFEAHPLLAPRWKGDRQEFTEDNRRHLVHLGEALFWGRPALFTEYAAWAASLLAGLNIPGEALALNLELLRTAVALELEGAGGSLASQYLDAARAKIEGATPELSSYIRGSEPLDVLARDYLAALLRGERHTAGAGGRSSGQTEESSSYANRLILGAVESGTSIKDIYLLVFQRAQYELGRLWHSNRIGVGQEHYCTSCTQLIMSQLFPRILSAERNGRRVVVTCVSGELHQLGARMLADFLEMAGWDTFFLGADTPISGTLQQVAERAPHVLAISASMPFHVQAVADLIAATRAAGSPPRILVGGAPFNSLPGLWKDVGADGCARDAAEAIAVVGAWSA
jgi:methanogenic corrinoid protein MtbC1